MIKYFQNFFEFSGYAYFLLDSTTLEIVDVNPKSLEVFRLKDRSEVIAKPFYEVSTCDFGNHVDQITIVNFKKLIRKEQGYAYQQKVRLTQNNTFDASFEFSLIQFGDEDFILVSVKDISKEKELNESMETYEAIYNQLPDGIVIHLNGVIIGTNRSFQELNEEEDVTSYRGKHIASFFSEQDREKIEEHITHPEKGKFIIVSRKSKNNNWHKFVLESFETKYHDQQITTTIVSDYQLQEDLAKEQLRANLASEANILLEQEIEKHKETQRKLETSQEISKSVFNSSIDTIISSDLENNITEVSPSACYAFKYSREEFLTLNAADIYANKEEFQNISQSLSTDGFYIGEVTNKRKDGSEFTCFLSCAVMRNKKGDHIGYMGISRDITDLKKAEEELIKSEKKYRDLFVNLGDALVIVDNNNKILDLNNAAKKLFNSSNCIGKQLFDFVHDDDLDYVKERSKEFRQKGSIVNVEFRVKNGERVKHVNLSSTAIYEGDKYVGSRDIIRDITQEKEYQELIVQQTSHLESIFENKSDVIMCTLDSKYNLTAFNTKLEEFIQHHLGITLKIGMNFMDILINSVSDQVKEGLQEYYEKATKGYPTQFEGILKSLKSNEVWIETFLSPITVEGKSAYDIALMAMDITDKKEAEIEITKSLQEKEVLLKEVHHRVKNNLQVISSILNLQSSYVKDKNTLYILRESQNRVKSMSFIHESLYRSKDFSQVNFSDYLNNLINNVVHTFLLPDKDVMLKTDLGAVNLNLDQAIPCGLILNELLTNAMKYAFVGIDNPELEVRIHERDNVIFIHVEDNGIGLPKDFRIDETNSLGLQLVQTLTDQLDGTLELKSKEGTKYLLTFEKMNQSD
ncbi:PAS domain S-box protein [Parvicella tangerina]|uniref:PAS domain S-box protein n=1 Tax=Parvicella tangerina TaxID=2829795 RepID=UPI00215CB7D6|nr:PAS domain S-box protein [Parvicella tangerina]